MKNLENKIDFSIIIGVKNANPNGDPLNGNRPRIDYDGYGEISDVCLKRKIRDRSSENGHPIFVQSNEKKVDDMPSLKARAESDEYGLGKDSFNLKKISPEETAKLACKKWLDVRTFGQLFAFKNEAKDGVSIAIRGPVSIQSAFSVEPVNITSIQITKSVNGEGDGTKKSSDTMGMKHRVDNGFYVTHGSISPYLAKRTGFSYEDAKIIKNILPVLFENDESSARPSGSMWVEALIWWEHDNMSGQYSSHKVHNAISINTDGTYSIDELPGLLPEVCEP